MRDARELETWLRAMEREHPIRLHALLIGGVVLVLEVAVALQLALDWFVRWLAR